MRRRGSRRRVRRGAVLLEVLIAIAILSTSAVALIILLGESTQAVHRARQREAEMRAANAFLHAVALWPREDLDRRLGARRQGSWLLHIHRQTPALYELSLTDSLSRDTLLKTTLYRAVQPGEGR